METEISKRVTGLLQHSEQICKLHFVLMLPKRLTMIKCQAHKKRKLSLKGTMQQIYKLEKPQDVS